VKYGAIRLWRRKLFPSWLKCWRNNARKIWYGEGAAKAHQMAARKIAAAAHGALQR